MYVGREYDWEAMKQAYILSEKSYAGIAQEFGASEKQVHKRASAERWFAEREAYR